MAKVEEQGVSQRLTGTAGEIRALTGLRGLAAVLVASYHFTDLGFHAPRLLAPLCRHGYLGVDLFFVLSGFLMARTYGARCGSWAAYRSFMARRFARVYPMYVIAVAATFLLVRTRLVPTLSPGAQSWHRLAIDLAMLQCLGAGPSLLPVTWSLSTEWITYLAFPALVRLLLQRTARLAVLAAIVCSSIILLLCLAPDSWVGGLARTPRQAWLDVSDIATPFPLLRCVADFSIGMLTWRIGAWPALRAYARPGWEGSLLVLAIAMKWTGAVDYPATLGFACILTCLGMPQNARGVAARLLASGPCHWLGVVSYPFYLTHLLVWQVLGPPFARVGLPNLTLLVPALGLAWLGQIAVEQPARLWLTRVLVPRRLGSVPG